MLRLCCSIGIWADTLFYYKFLALSSNRTDPVLQQVSPLLSQSWSTTGYGDSLENVAVVFYGVFESLWNCFSIRKCSKSFSFKSLCKVLVGIPKFSQIFIGPTFLPFYPLKFSKIQRKCHNFGLYPVGMDSDLLIYVLLSVFWGGIVCFLFGQQNILLKNSIMGEVMEMEAIWVFLLSSIQHIKYCNWEWVFI